MQTTKDMTFHACIVRVQVLICYVNTRLQRIFNRFCPGLSVVSDPPNVLRDNQGRLTMYKLRFLFRSRYNDGVL